MRFDRQSGVLLHVTALPGPHGIGDLGDGARAFVDFLAAAEQSLWQFCPLGPTSPVHGESPYQSFSAFAGNPLLIGLDRLRDAGLLTADDLEPVPDFDPDAVEYDRVRAYKTDALRTACERFFERADADVGDPTAVPELDADADGNGSTPTDAADAADANADDALDADGFAAFREREAAWLDDYALFRALKDRFDGVLWTEWPADAKTRDRDALATYRAELGDEIRYRLFCQFVFDRQWRALAAYAHDRGVDLVGDLPIYVALDSADAWAAPEAFDLDDANDPAAVAGVPPNPGDDGQRWGNPLYDWERLAETEYDWWLDRLSRLFDLVDAARIDHFKAFDEFWAVPAGADDPAAGEWRPGPGAAFFETVEAELGDLPFLVEDLGFLDQSLVDLRDRFDFPGMRVPHYADWCAQGDMHQPMHYLENCVAYTATHDTDTTVGYYRDLPADQTDCLHYNLGIDGSDVAWSLIDAVWNSNAGVAFTTVQDLLGLGSEARFNTPGTAEGNWRWRCRRDALSDEVADRLATTTDVAIR